MPIALASNKLCHACHLKLPTIKQACKVCGLPCSAVDTPCGQCLKSSPPYDLSLSAFHYEQPISDFITQFKYGNRLDLLPLMTNYLLHTINLRLKNESRSQPPELIIPIPLHYKKRNHRGFNQSRLIAKNLSKSLDIPLSGDEVKRVRQTKTQASLDANERKKNLKNAFEINKELPERVAIVDDIITTGTTVSELAMLASKHGAKQIEVWSLARAYST